MKGEKQERRFDELREVPVGRIKSDFYQMPQLQFSILKTLSNERHKSFYISPLFIFNIRKALLEDSHKKKHIKVDIR